MKHVGTIGYRIKDKYGNSGTIKAYGEVVGEMFVQFDKESGAK